MVLYVCEGVHFLTKRKYNHVFISPLISLCCSLCSPSLCPPFLPSFFKLSWNLIVHITKSTCIVHTYISWMAFLILSTSPDAHLPTLQLFMLCDSGSQFPIPVIVESQFLGVLMKIHTPTSHHAPTEPASPREGSENLHIYQGIQALVKYEKRHSNSTKLVICLVLAESPHPVLLIRRPSA